jgi:hypothetical protein
VGRRGRAALVTALVAGGRVALVTRRGAGLRVRDLKLVCGLGAGEHTHALDWIKWLSSVGASPADIK